MTGAASDSPFLAACRGEDVSRVPVWFMRQAGRSLPEYREIKGDVPILEAVKDPDLAAEITLQPVRRYGVDAAILYSDIVVPAHAIGFGVEIQSGVGPVIEKPFRHDDDLDRLRPLDPEGDTGYVLETVRRIVKETDVPVIGFAGAPFTVASYLIEGRPSRDYLHTKAMMLDRPDLFGKLLARLAEMAVTSIRSQVEAGARAVQMFDSWAGALSKADYDRFVLPHSKAVFDGLADLDVPRIHFGVGTGELLTSLADAGADVVGIDWRVPLDVAAERLGHRVAVQGNLDPAVCFAGWDAVRERVTDVLARGATAPGHVFNLGHGVLPPTDPEVLERVVELVHAHDPSDRNGANRTLSKGGAANQAGGKTTGAGTPAGSDN